MKRAKKQSANFPTPIKIITFGAIAGTLYFGTTLQDPFNTPKLAILLVIGMTLLPFINIKQLRNLAHGKSLAVIVGILASGFVISALFTDVKYIAIFGESQRKLGVLTYLSFIIIFLASLLYFNLESSKYIYFSVYFLSAYLSIYAILQTTDNDPIKWNNNYNKIITTFGNPNFASAFFAILAVLVFSRIFYTQKIFYKFLNSILVTLMLFLILRSDSRQGLVAFSIGAGFVVVYAIFCRNKTLGFISVAIFILLFIFAILGMLQIGPLTSLLYKNSVSVRGFYWRAGIEMFLNQPIHGIGLDRFGSYFKEMRELQYPLNYGFNLTSTNAHNVYIQLFATGGILVGLPYLALKIAIAVLGMRHLFISSRYNFAFVGLFAGWLAFEAQSIISIDNIGLSIWGWILGGAILGISVNKPSSIESTRIPKSLQEPSIRMLFAAVIFISTSIFGLFFLKGESEMWKTRSIFDSNQSASNEVIKNRIFETMSIKMIDPVWKIMLIDYLAQSGYLDEAKREINMLLDTDKRNLDALLVKSRIYVASQDTSGAIETQLEISKYDPQNAENYLQLVKNYMLLNNSEMAQKMRSKIIEIAPESEQAKLADKEFTKEIN